MVIDGEGMPFLGNPFTKGKLFVVFSIKFPEKAFSEAQVVRVSSFWGFSLFFFFLLSGSMKTASAPLPPPQPPFRSLSFSFMRPRRPSSSFVPWIYNALTFFLFF